MSKFCLILLLLLPGCAVRGSEVRVAFDADHIVATRASGFADRLTRRRVTADDPVRVASVSKLVVALGVMRLIEAGRLDLDRDVSTWLGWQARNPAFPDTPVTLRMLLSHTAGIRDAVDYAIPLEGSVRATLDSASAWDNANAPGTYFAYANLNFPVVASVMEAATHERFDKLMRRVVFDPLGIEACFNWTTCSDGAVQRAVVLYGADGSVRRDDLRGQRPACPVVASTGCDLSAYRPGNNGALFSPQGGLRISMRDLAKVGRMLLKDGDSFLSAASVATMRGPEWGMGTAGGGNDELGFFCEYGLAVQSLGLEDKHCRDDLFGDGRPRFGHAGEAYGVRSGLWIDPTTGTGVAFFATAVPDDARKGRSAFTAVEERMIKAR